MKDILIISYYYPPEIGAASNRIFQLASGLQENFNITVLTPLPNYPEGQIFENYKGKFKHSSIEKNIAVKRLWIFPSNSKNKFVRLISMLSYSMSLLLYFILNNIPKTVIIQSPPLLVAFSSIFFLRSKNRKLVLNVSDLWPDAGLDLGALRQNKFYTLLKRIEHFNYINSQVILGQSEEILCHIKTINNTSKLILFRNYPKLNVLPPLYNSNYTSNPIKIVYAGLIGIAQGIVRLCENLHFDGIELHIYGAGAETEKLKDHIKNHPEHPIVYHGSVKREDLHNIILSYDIAIIPLVKRIYGSVPSKIFELAALGMPVLYFGGGEGETIVKNYNLGWVVSPGDYNSLNTTIQRDIRQGLKKNDRLTVRETSANHFSYADQLNELKDCFY
jgi:glycosyltransferase involved in cell wall biosynthesis